MCSSIYVIRMYYESEKIFGYKHYKEMGQGGIAKVAQQINERKKSITRSRLARPRAWKLAEYMYCERGQAKVFSLNKKLNLASYVVSITSYVFVPTHLL